MSRGLTIAVDGYSSCGKSTLARDLAKQLNYIYIDSGAMYRAVTLYLMENQVSLQDPQSLVQALGHITIELDQNGTIRLNGKDVTARIRQADVSGLVSEVAAVSAVRRQLVSLQKSYGIRGGIVMDGRDIGTVVFPNADLKIFLTADPEVRARRRYDELRERNTPLSFEEVVENLKHRDHIDSTREDSPLTQAKDAILVDNTEMDRESQLEHVLSLVRRLKEDRS